MIISSQTRHDAPLVGVTIDGVPVNYLSIGSIELDFSENMHDMAVLTFSGLAPSLILGYVNRPIQISFGSGPYDLADFYGYVVYLEPNNQTSRGAINGSLFQETRAYCLGTSYDMKAKKASIWESVTLPQLTDDISSTYRYTYEVPNDRFVFPRVAQAGESDWQTLVKAANRLGYSVTCHGTHINVYDPLRSLALHTEYVTLENLIGAKGDPKNKPGRILNFQGTFGKTTPDGDSSTSSLGFLDRSGVLAATDLVDEPTSGLGRPYGARFNDKLAINADSEEMAAYLIEAGARQRMPFNATVNVRGVALPRPGSVVNVIRYNAAFDGFWLVRSVYHTIIGSTFSTEIRISKDATNDEPVRLQPSRGPYQSPEPIVLSGQWVARREVSHVY